VNGPVLLDTSFLVALERETAHGEHGPARKSLLSLRGRHLVIGLRVPDRRQIVDFLRAWIQERVMV